MWPRLQIINTSGHVNYISYYYCIISNKKGMGNYLFFKNTFSSLFCTLLQEMLHKKHTNTAAMREVCVLYVSHDVGEGDGGR